MSLIHEISQLERERMAMQAELDAGKTQSERNKLGQFSTPGLLANDILAHAIALFPHNQRVSFLDPAIGTGSFYSALCQSIPPDRIDDALGFEIDSHYHRPAAQLWAGSDLTIINRDFTKEFPVPRFNLIICNPPYVRHHHLDSSDKERMQRMSFRTSGMKLSGLTGLYCYFLGISHAWMQDDGIGGWLIPSEFMDVNYGRALKNYLLNEVTLLRIHRFDPNDTQFPDALVSSAVVFFKKSKPLENHTIVFSYGGNLHQPRLLSDISSRELTDETKWTRFPTAKVRIKTKYPKISDFFQIKRGIATGDNKFFIMNRDQISERRLPMEAFRPILPSPRYLPCNEVLSDPTGMPMLERQLFVLDTKLPLFEIEENHPHLFNYLEQAETGGTLDRYICRHRRPWYSQDARPPAPIVCTYLGRSDAKGGRPFRFILNNSKATVANVYLAMYPVGFLARSLKRNPSLIRDVWEALNALQPYQLLDEGRVYGGGLHKLEPSELANVDATNISRLLPDFTEFASSSQAELFTDDFAD